MRLGEMLVRDGRITEAQLHDALDTQRKSGGRLGTILTEMSLLDSEALTVYLGLELGIPVATGATLERCKRSAIALLKPEEAAHFQAVPIVIQGQTVIVAVDDPHDLEKLEAIASLTGYRVLPRVAPEVRIHYYVERLYGIPRPARYAAMGDEPRGSRDDARPDLPALPLPGLPVRKEQPELPPTPAPDLSAPAPEPDLTIPSAPSPEALAAAAAHDDDDDDILELDDADLIEALDADEAEFAKEVPSVRDQGEGGDAEGRGRRTSYQPPVSAPKPYEPLDLDGAIEKLREVDRRSKVARALLSYCKSEFEIAVLFLIRDNNAFGWKGFGPKLSSERIDSILIPLSQPSVLQVAAESGETLLAAPFPATLHKYLYRCLHSEAPTRALVQPITIANRIVNLLYVQRKDGADPSDADRDAIAKLASEASRAYIRLIKRTKRAAS